MHVTDEMVDLIREAIRFANWGAGQGLCPGAEEGISGPEDFLFEYSCKSGDEDWETLADRVSAALRDAQKRLRGAGMLGGDDDPVNAALKWRDGDG